MNIKKIKKLTNHRYKIEFENNTNIIIYEDVIIDNNILFKKQIDEALMLKIEKENLYFESYYKVLKYVMTKMRSIHEVEVYLDKLEADSKTKKKIIDKLKNINLLNDKIYTEAFISDKINLSNDGPLKIKKEIKSKGVDEVIINNELEKYEDEIFEEKIIKLLNKKKNIKYSNYIYKQKMLNYFINLGYESSFVLPFLNDINSDTSELLQKEYDLLYKKLSKKYTDKKLDYEIKMRLYKKGFSMDELNNIIKE